MSVPIRLLVFVQYRRVFWCKEMDCLFPYDLRRKMTNLVCTALTDEYDLDLGAKTQPSVNIDDYSSLPTICTSWDIDQVFTSIVTKLFSETYHAASCKSQI